MNRGEVEELVQSTVRKLNTGPEACLTNPRVLSFFNIMKDSFHRCIKTLAASAATPEDKTAAYQLILTWPHERMAEEVELLLKRYPTVKDSYTYAAVYIVEQTFKKNGSQVKLKLPSFQSFVHTFYSTMVQSEPMQQGTYDGLQFFEKEMLTCQCFCNALYNSIKTEPVVKAQSVIIEPSAIVDKKSVAPEKAPRAGKSAAGARADAGAAGVSTSAARVSTSAARVSTSAERTSQVASASRFSMRALSPLDSVSQIRSGDRAPADTSFRGLLTEEFLNKHRQQVQGGGKADRDSESQASVAAASIRKASSKKASVKVVDIEEHPQKHLVSTLDSTSDSSTQSSDSSHGSYQARGRDRSERVQVFKESSRHRDRDHSDSRHSSYRERDDRRDSGRDDRSERDADRRDSGRGDRSDSARGDRVVERVRQNPNRRH
jgi:hypothetical protein